MSEERGDDVVGSSDTVGVDPLLADPKVATGRTGEIERPGDHVPWWFVPGLCAVALLLVGLLVVVADRRSTPRTAASATAGTSSVTVSPTTSLLTLGGASPGQLPQAAPDVDVASSVVPSTTVDPRLDDLPPSGTVRFSGSDREILVR